MNPEDPILNPPRPATEAARSGLAERAGRALYLCAGGLLMSVLVSCACGPIR